MTSYNPKFTSGPKKQQDKTVKKFRIQEANKNYKHIRSE